jgi:hypothetical protein
MLIAPKNNFVVIVQLKSLLFIQVPDHLDVGDHLQQIWFQLFVEARSALSPFLEIIAHVGVVAFWQLFLVAKRGPARTCHFERNRGHCF